MLSFSVSMYICIGLYKLNRLICARVCLQFLLLGLGGTARFGRNLAGRDTLSDMLLKQGRFVARNFGRCNGPRDVTNWLAPLDSRVLWSENFALLWRVCEV